MIPTIETIVDDLIAGTISRSQAIAWLKQQAQSELDDLRDYFAVSAMQGLIPRMGTNDAHLVARSAYIVADEMLKARAA